jgi:hypothetical protein
MVRAIAVVIVVAASAVGCGDHGSASSLPPSDHGGFHGQEAKVFDLGYTGCYREVSDRKPWDFLKIQERFGGSPQMRHAMDAGCSAGTRAWSTKSGVSVVTISGSVRTSPTTGP